MNFEANVVIVDREDSYDFIAPLISESLRTNYIIHFDDVDDAIDGRR